jgi:hypothetical protein
MKVIIAGGRDFNDMTALVAAIKESGFEITEVVSGRASGADMLGLYWARANGVPETHFPAQWDIFGKASRLIRNRRMAKYADALIAMPGGRGTASMIAEARKRGLPVYEPTSTTSNCASERGAR